jgi:hypothetical protein
MTTRLALLALAALSLLMAACEGLALPTAEPTATSLAPEATAIPTVRSGDPAQPTAQSATPTPEAAATSTPTAAPTATVAPVSSGLLPLGDGHLSTGPERGAVWSCTTTFGGGGAFVDGPWLLADGTWDPLLKARVDGAVTWPSNLSIVLEGTSRIVSTNDLPDHPTGTFPIASGDDAYAYDRNPNAITAQQVRLTLAAQPEAAARPSCLPLGAIGVLLTGSVFFNALDALGRDAAAHEVQDGCDGHPERSGAYHYHTLTPCLDVASTGHSPLVGYALDGYGLYGPLGEDGKPLTNADLDACHGHTHAVEWDGASRVLYHYHATAAYPYTLGCFHGTPVASGAPPRP